MFSSVFNTAALPAGSSSNPAKHYQHQHQLLRVSSAAYSHVSSNHHHHTTNRDAKQHDNIDHHVPAIESTTNLFITAFGNTTMNNKTGSVARATKKKCDKRSKIKTSQGLRDRRVRLSIDIARKFFDLQDLLGFDKPSTTVEWLLNKSNKAILELSPGASSSTTSSEAVGTEDGIKSLSSSRSTATCSTNQIHQVVLLSSDDSLKTMKQKEAMVIREARERARARARARTLAKLNHKEAVRLLNCHNFSTPSLSSKTLSYAERKQEEKGEEEEDEQLRSQKHHQQLKTHCYIPNSNLLLDWDISSVIPLPSSSSATNTLNFSTDVEIYTRSSCWDQLSLHNYRTL